MKQMEYKLWCDYHLGRVDRPFTPDEEREIRANEFAMHLLVPTDAVKSLALKHGGLEALISSMYRIEAFAELFDVAPEVFYFKVKEMKELEDEFNLYDFNLNSNKKETILTKILKLFKRQ